MNFNWYKNLKNEIFNLYYQSYRILSNKFIKKLSKTKKYKNKYKILLDGFWDSPFHYVRLAIIKQVLSNKYKLPFEGIYFKKSSKYKLLTFKSLELEKIIFLPETIPHNYVHKAKKILANINSSEDFINYNFVDNFPTHFIYDGILRSEQVGSLDFLSKSVILKYLSRFFYLIDFYNNLFNINKYKLIVLSHPTTLNYSCLIYCALKKNIKVLIINYRNQHITIRKLYHLSEYVGKVDDHPSYQDFLKIDARTKKILTMQGKKYLNELYSGKSGEINISKNFTSIKSHFNSKKDFNKSINAPFNKINVIFLVSCMSDFPNSSGKSFFIDHVDLLFKTLKIIESIKDVNWIFRPHPFENRFGAKTRLNQFQNKILLNGNFLFPEKGNVHDILNYADIIITPQGSAGFEFTSLKRKVIAVRDCNYTDWGFIKYASSIEDYKYILRNLKKIKYPDEQSIEKSLIYTTLRAKTLNMKSTNNYYYPYGRYGNKLWTKIPSFIKNNKKNIDIEIQLISQWLETDYKSYSVFKNIKNYE